MTQRLQDDEFETVLTRALRLETAPVGLAQHVGDTRMKGSWFLAILSPARIAASAAVLSLMIGFALGWTNTRATDDPETNMAAVVYAANDVGEF